MSTANPNVLFDNRSVGNFRAWAQAMHDSFIAVGLVQTADTGQVNISTMAVPGAINTYAGYEIFRFADTLQATKPIFIKVEYGNGPTSVGALAAFRISISNNTNGAGSLSGTVVSTAQQIQGQALTADVQPQPAYFCSDLSSLVFAWPTSTASGGFRPSVVMIERTRNSDGTANGDGVAFATMQGYGATGSGTAMGDSMAQMLSFLSVTVGPAYRWWPIASPNIYSFWDSAGSVGTDINLFPFSVATPKPEAQMMSVLGCYSYAFATETPVTVVVNGGSHSYLALGFQAYVSTYTLPLTSTWAASAGGVGYGVNQNVCSVIMRYE